MTHLDIASLPTLEKIQLMESLWDSLCREPSTSTAVPAWHEPILAERLNRLDNGDEPISSWSEAKQRIRKLAEGE
jgi:putative addiction module component (TIGR02574 family)